MRCTDTVASGEQQAEVTLQDLIGWVAAALTYASPKEVGEHGMGDETQGGLPQKQKMEGQHIWKASDFPDMHATCGWLIETNTMQRRAKILMKSSLPDLGKRHRWLPQGIAEQVLAASELRHWHC